jgi:hypothetical protein
MKRFLALALPSALLAAAALTFAAGQQPQQKDKDKKKPQPPREYNSGIVWEEPKPIDPGPVGGPPADAVVLFDGKDMSAWKGADKWEIKDGYGIARSAATTKQHFGDCQLHVEWASPLPVKGSGQGRGNNGVKMMGRYEIQILDSYENKTYLDGMCAALYKQRPPLVNASRKPGEWQSFDILFTAPRFGEKGELLNPGYVTLLHNGLLVHNHVEIQGTTAYDRPPAYTPHAARGPILLAYHGQPVRFRNIWVREVRELEAKKKEEK